MPKSLVFNQDPSSHLPMMSHLLARKCIPYKVLHEQVRSRWGKNYGDLGKYEREHFDNDMKEYVEKTSFEWIHDFAEKIERAADKRLHFTFSYYVFVQHGDEDSEYVYRCSMALWFVTINDDTGNSIHKNWTIAIDELCDLVIRRGNLGDDDSIFDGPYSYGIWKKAEERLLDVAREYGRLEKFRKERNKKS